jgi:translation initiation factor 1
MSSQINYPEPTITIFVSQRNGKKCDTHVYGWCEEYDLQKICSYLKKKFDCGGSVVNNKEYGETIKLNGDKKDEVYNFLLDEEICTKNKIILRGI